MAQTLMVFNKPKLLLADTSAGLGTGDAYECQITAARFDAAVTFATVPATGCNGPSQSPSSAGWTLNLSWLDDWSAPGGGLSGYAFENGDPPTRKWVRLIPNADDTATQMDAEVWITPGGMGGTFGDGSAGATTAAWQVIGKPDATYPVGP